MQFDGTLYATDHVLDVALARTVKSRSPSCVGSTVQSGGELRLGLGDAAELLRARSSAWRSSNLPATSSTALSGW
jgi:hypothetical protein